MIDLRPHLRALAESLPAGTSIPVPREALLQLLDGSADVCKTSETRDLTVTDLAARFDRKPSAVRAWLERGDFPQAYKLNGREWRVPASSVEAFQMRQRAGKGSTKNVATVGLGDWRKGG